MNSPGASLPIVLVAVGRDEDALDAGLAALEANTPAGTRVHASVAADGPDAVVTVTDDGPGIPREGGHVGFAQGALPPGDVFWLPRAVGGWLLEHA